MLLTRFFLAAVAALGIGLVPVTPAAAHGSHAGANDALLIASASWHGRPIQNPHRHEALRGPVAEAPPSGWSAGSVSFGAGYHRPGGSDRVRELQKRLRSLGYRPGPVDGLFGPRTRAAVAWFQVKHGLPLHGRATFRTVRHLRAATGAGEPARNVQVRTERRATPEASLATAAAPRTVTTRADRIVEGEGGPSPAGFVPLLLLALLVAGIALWLRRRRTAVAPAVPAPVPSRGRALAYVLIAAGQPQDTQLRSHARAVEAQCAAQGLTVAGLLADAEDDRLIWQRPGLKTAVDRLVRGEVDFLMVTRMKDAAGPDLEHLAKTVEGEIAIARWQQQPLAGEREVSHA